MNTEIGIEIVDIVFIVYLMKCGLIHILVKPKDEISFLIGLKDVLCMKLIQVIDIVVGVNNIVYE